MTEKMQAILEHVTMNIPESEIWAMIPELPEMLNYEFAMDRVPYDGMYSIIDVNGQGMLCLLYTSNTGDAVSAAGSTEDYQGGRLLYDLLCTRYPQRADKVPWRKRIFDPPSSPARRRSG